MKELLHDYTQMLLAVDAISFAQANEIHRMIDKAAAEEAERAVAYYEGERERRRSLPWWKKLVP